VPNTNVDKIPASGKCDSIYEVAKQDVRFREMQGLVSKMRVLWLIQSMGKVAFPVRDGN
jgi:hypothetical protein